MHFEACISFLLLYNKLPQNYQLKTIQIYYQTVFTGQESGCELGRSHQVKRRALASPGALSDARGSLPNALRLSGSRQLLDQMPVFLLAAGQQPL